MRRPIAKGLMGFLLSISLAVAATACGGDDPTDLQSEGTGSDEDTPNAVVIATDFEFSVDDLEVKAGDFILEFDNQGESAHTYSVYKDAEYSDLAETTGNLNAGQRNRYDMSLTAGSYFVRCDVHPTQMQGTLVAE